MVPRRAPCGQGLGSGDPEPLTSAAARPASGPRVAPTKALGALGREPGAGLDETPEGHVAVRTSGLVAPGVGALAGTPELQARLEAQTQV